MQGLVDRAVAIVAELLEEGVRDGVTPPLPAREVARALCSMNAQYLLDLVALDPEFDREPALEALWVVWSRITWPQAR